MAIGNRYGFGWGASKCFAPSVVLKSFEASLQG
jgi:hypothetical protein